MVPVPTNIPRTGDPRARDPRTLRASPPATRRWRRALGALGAWLLPPLAALALALFLWQAVVVAEWRPVWVLPGPRAVLARVVHEIASGEAFAAARITLGRAAVGYMLALAVGTALGLLMSRVPPLRTAFGALITGLQTMPSVAWFPLAILLFQLGEGAILFVVVLGAAPSIANGLLHSIDHIPPQLVRAGRMLGATGFALLRHVMVPAAMPGFLAGLKQGWAFSWRSLMAGELLVIVGDRPSIGARLHYARELSDAEGLIAWMIVVLVVGIAVDLALFGTLERRVRSKRGLLQEPE